MKIYDRITSVTIDGKDLPSRIDLGRFCFADSKKDLTNRNIDVGADKIIEQGLLEDANKSLQDLFYFFRDEMSKNTGFTINPLVQNVAENFPLNEFEILLEENLFHLEEISRHPHCLLQRTIEKVNVSRAKRIPARSYQNLASHTEDWLHKSIVNFEPRRILTEEMDSEYDVYENQVTVALLERCLLYLNKRTKQISDINDFLEKYEKLLSDRDDSKGWYEKIRRNLDLIGKVYEDEHYSDNKGKDVLNSTQNRLSRMSERLKALKGARLFVSINSRMVNSLMAEQDVRPTNVIANHRHYRYVRKLWLALNRIDRMKSEEERIGYEHEVIDGVRCYSMSLIVYVVKHMLGYEIKGSYDRWIANREFYPTIWFNVTKNATLRIKIGDYEIMLVVLCNPTELKDSDVSDSIYVLSLNLCCSSQHLIRISPYDVDSTERVAKVIKSYIIRNFVSKIRQNYEYAHILKDYVNNCIPTDYIEFHDDFTYSLTGILQCDKDLDMSAIIRKLQQNDRYLNRSRADEEMIQNSIKHLVNDIKQKSNDLSNSIYCLGCQNHNHINIIYLRNLKYIKCNECHFVLDSTTNRVVLKNTDEKYRRLSEDDWGMDYIEFEYNAPENQDRRIM